MSEPGWLRDWRARHRTAVSFWLHMVGIPLTIAAAGALAWQIYHARYDPSHWDYWWRPLALVLMGYFLQYLGHRYEGNDMGEVILVKRWLGKPYIAVSRRYAGHSSSSQPPEKS
jgi:uncharacterized membrane protein YGL010W